MKKVISIALVLVLALSVFAMVGCGKDTTPETPETPAADGLKFGLGVVANYKASSATEEDDGAGEFNTTAVAVLLDAEGKIVDIDLDTAQIKPSWTADGKKVDVEDLRTKYEKGTDYGMAAANIDKNGDGKSLEWNEQADAFMATATGKTLDEVKALAGEDMYAIGDLAVAGCTINVAEFMGALEKAVANAVATDATAEDAVNVGIVASQYYESKDATEDEDGLNQYDTAIVALVLGADGKVKAAKTDAAQAKFAFDAEGAVAEDATEGTIKTKLELGDEYGMAAAINYGMDLNGDGKVLEWYDQAAAFEAALVGKTAAEFGALADEKGYGTGDLAVAGCTIAIGDMLKAADIAAKAA